MHVWNQKKRIVLLAVLHVLALVAALATACGRPAYDLTVRITDTEGNPLPGAMVGLHENGQTLLADLEGQVRWSALSEEQASLVIVAQGYMLQSAVVPLERGANETSFALEEQRPEPEAMFDSP